MKFDENYMVEMFSKKKKKEKKLNLFKKHEEKEAPKKKIRVLSDKRSNAIGILLSKFDNLQVIHQCKTMVRMLTYVVAILKLDDTVLPLHVVQGMIVQLPTDEEVRSIQDVKDPSLLETAEQY